MSGRACAAFLWLGVIAVPGTIVAVVAIWWTYPPLLLFIGSGFLFLAAFVLTIKAIEILMDESRRAR